MLTLNLIPPKTKQELHSGVLYRNWLRSLIVLAVFGLFGTGGLFSAQMMMHRHAAATHQELLTIQQRQAKNAGSDLTTTTGALNTTIKTIATVLGSPRSWNRDTAIVLSSLPTGTTLSELTLIGAGKFRLVGITDSRQTFVTLEQQLKDNPQLEQVTTASTASKRTAVPFDFSGIVKSEGTKK